MLLVSHALGSPPYTQPTLLRRPDLQLAISLRIHPSTTGVFLVTQHRATVYNINDSRSYVFAFTLSRCSLPYHPTYGYSFLIGESHSSSTKLNHLILVGWVDFAVGLARGEEVAEALGR